MLPLIWVVQFGRDLSITPIQKNFYTKFDVFNGPAAYKTAQQLQVSSVLPSSSTSLSFSSNSSAVPPNMHTVAYPAESHIQDARVVGVCSLFYLL